MVRNFLNGKFGLAKTFWWGVFSVVVVAQALFFLLAWVYLVAQPEGPNSWLDIFIDSLTLILALHLLLMLRALWKAGFDDRLPSGWGIIGIALTLYFAIVTSHLAFTQFFPNAPTSTRWFASQVRGLNILLPMDLGDGYILEHASVSGGDLIYYVEANFSVNEVIKSEFETEISITTPLGQDTCEEFEGLFKGGIQRVVYEYTFTDGVIRSVLTAEECFDWLDG